jgi:hypothetical protein
VPPLAGIDLYLHSGQVLGDKTVTIIRLRQITLISFTAVENRYIHVQQCTRTIITSESLCRLCRAIPRYHNRDSTSP